MIDVKQVITMKIPFPTISANLAVSPHMYVCLEKEKTNKKFVKCQTLKPYHLKRNKRPFFRVIENPNVARNPFKRMTLIDCDKLFLTEGIQISDSLLTKRRKDVCDNLFNEIKYTMNHSEVEEHLLESDSLVTINSKIMKVN